ncbi:MAG: dihydropteroate synthase [Bradymonadales bacterium]|nr:dihydropteroate synthase [Bradymonadales bacterium]
MATGEPEPPNRWSIKSRQLDLSKRPLVMGILNVTPDSFSHDGLYLQPDAAVERALAMVQEGADLIDVGGESSRPGAIEVSIDEEIRRVIPVIQGIADRSPVPLSIDTTKAPVARLAIQAGAHVINDISGLRLDPGIANVAAETGAGLILMHMQGTPRTMQIDPRYDDLFREIGDFLASSADRARSRGVAREAIVIDPGIGFGKTFRHNWEIIAGLQRLCRLGYPVLVGASRKRFLQVCAGIDRGDLLAATLAVSVAACLHGAKIVRVHDVRSHRLAMEAMGKLLEQPHSENAAGS